MYNENEDERDGRRERTNVMENEIRARIRDGRPLDEKEKSEMRAK
jgi:hypothetical protein